MFYNKIIDIIILKCNCINVSKEKKMQNLIVNICKKS